MAGNKHQSEIELAAGGVDYTLKLSARAIASLETEFNQSIGEILGILDQGSVRHLAAILRQCTQPRMSENQAYDAIDELGAKGVLSSIGDAVMVSGLFKGAVETVENPPKATA